MKGDVSVWVSSVFFAVAAVLVRDLSSHYSALFISLIRFVTGASLAALSIKATGRTFALDNKSDLFWRSFFGVLSMLLYYGSMALAGSGRGTLLNTLYPIFVVVFGSLFFSEPFRKKDVISLCFAVPGVFIIFWDGSGLTSLGDLLGLGSALAAGMSTHFMKRARATNSSEIIYLSVCVFGIVPCLFSVPEFAKVSWIDLSLLAVTGAVVYAAQVISTWGMKFISAARSSILSFSKVPMTFLLAAFFLNETLTPKFLFGAALVVISVVAIEGLHLKRSEKVSGS
jgi:drug/metabolite transporter (DMT)-like permease